MSVIGHSLGSVIMYDLLVCTAECMGVDVATEDSPVSSPSLPTSSSRDYGEGSLRAVQLAGKRGAAGGVVRFDPSMRSLESNVQLEEPMDMAVDEVGKWYMYMYM